MRRAAEKIASGQPPIKRLMSDEVVVIHATKQLIVNRQKGVLHSQDRDFFPNRLRNKSAFASTIFQKMVAQA